MAVVRFKWWALSLAVSGCSVFIRVDENDYKIPTTSVGGTDGAIDDDGPNGGLGGQPNTDTGGTPNHSGGMGGAPDPGSTGGRDTGGSPSGGTGGMSSTGGSGSGGHGNGTGGGSGGSHPSGGSGNVLEYYYPLDATMGAEVRDAGSAMLHGAASSADGWAPQGGIVGGGYELLPGRSLQLSPSLASTAPFSVSFWMNPTQGSYRVVASKRAPGDNTGFLVLQNNSLMQVRTGGENQDRSHDQLNGVPVLGDPKDAAWYHVVLTYQENLGGPQDRLRLYVDGALAIETVDELSGSSPENASAPLRFGDHMAGVPDFQGMLDEIRVFRWELSSDEVADLYQPDAAP